MKAGKVKHLEPEGTLAESALRIVAVRLEELRSFAPRAVDPTGVDALHDMRIAAKRLRYVLEITEPALGPSARRGAKTAKNLQDLLGDIHDCDVMLPRVHAHADRLRAQDAEWVHRAAGGRAKDLAPSAARSAPNRTAYRGLEALAVYLRARRAVLFDRFLREWQALERAGFGARLMEEPQPFSPRARSSFGRSSTLSSPRSTPTTAPFGSRTWAPVIVCTAIERSGSWPTSIASSPTLPANSWASNGPPASRSSSVKSWPSRSQMGRAVSRARTFGLVTHPSACTPSRASAAAMVRAS